MLLFIGVNAAGAELPAGFSEELVGTNLNAVTAITVAPDGRIFVAEQTGRLRAWRGQRELPTPALDLTSRVDDYWERGLIGITLHPEFPRAPHLFVVYVARQPVTHHVVSRFTMVGDRADPATELVLLEGEDQSKFGGSQPAGHQGGPICIGPDGKVYVGLGEQTAGAPAQSLTALQGKILRLNPDGGIPEDNPFYNQTTGKYRAIWALGIRNPFGLAFQPHSGRLFETDVGQTSWEEVNEIVKGGNYGWPEAEGFSTNITFRNPLQAYPPTTGRSIVGSLFYPAEQGVPNEQHKLMFPLPWRGKFFFADWAANWVKALDPDVPTNVLTFAKGFNAPVALAREPDGSLLVLNRGTIWRDGKNFMTNSGSLVRVRFTGLSQPISQTEVTRSPIPATLREAGVFRSLEPLEPGEGFIKFEPNAPPWQPGVKAERWIKMPHRGQLIINQQGEFEFPAGTIIVQHYLVESTDTPFETQLFWLTGPRQVRAAAYRWSKEKGSTELVEDGEVISLPGDQSHLWFSPGVEEQVNLDTIVTGFVLPVSPRQLSTEQLAIWNERGWFATKLSESDIAALPRLAPINDESGTLELRVRSYLDVNCSACHRPGGPSGGNFDARFLTPLENQNIINGEILTADLGILDGRIVVPGKPQRSVMLERVSRTDQFRMPPVAVNNDPQPLVPVLEQWIKQLSPTTPQK